MSAKHPVMRYEQSIANARTQIRAGYIQVDYSGPFEGNALKALGVQVLDLLKQTQLKGILVDLTHAAGHLSLMERYDLVNAMSDHFPKSAHLSVVINPSQMLKLMGFFWHRIASSRGFSVAINFEKIKARQWLIGTLNTANQTQSQQT